VSLLVVALDNTILNVALPTLARDLHATDSQLQWIVDGYTVVFAGLLISFGSLGDREGRRGALLIGLVVFAVGSGLSAFSGSAGQLIGSRCVMGAGGALVMPSTLSILTNVFTTPRERARAIGIWSGTSGLGIALGPIIGGWLLSHFWWGSVFLVNVPIVTAGFLAVVLLVPTSRDTAARRPDPGGTLLSIAGLGLLLWGIIEAPVDGWTSPMALGALTGGAVVIAAFVAWELRSDHPMFRMDFFASARFSAASVSVSLVFFALFGAMFLLTQYLQSVLGYSPLQAGLRLAPVAVTLATAAPLASLITERLGTKFVVVMGLCTIAIGLGMLSQLTVRSGYLPVLVAILVAGMGMGLTISPSTESIMGSLPAREAGVGSAMNGTNIQVGGALGVAVLGSVLNQHYRGHLSPALASFHLPPATAHAASSSLGGAMGVAAHLPAATALVLTGAAKVSFVGGINLADLLGMSVALAGALIALLFLPAHAGGPAPGATPDEHRSLRLAATPTADPPVGGEPEPSRAVNMQTNTATMSTDR
jgi:EmrB/QacA subfamily drug resistance transporter